MTRKAYLQTVHASVATTRCHFRGGGYSEVQGIMGNGHILTPQP